MKKNHELRVRVSKEELDKIQGKAKLYGLTASAFLRFLGLESKIEINVESH